MDEKVKTTLYLPRWLHRAIKTEALNTERGMTDIIIEQMSQRYPLAAGDFLRRETEAEVLTEAN